MPVPINELKGFKEFTLKKGEKTIEFNLTPSNISIISNNNKSVVIPGDIKIFVGGNQPGKGLAEIILW